VPTPILPTVTGGIASPLSPEALRSSKELSSSSKVTSQTSTTNPMDLYFIIMFEWLQLRFDFLFWRPQVFGEMYMARSIDVGFLL
jgi:hypothetical protein